LPPGISPSPSRAVHAHHSSPTYILCQSLDVMLTGSRELRKKAKETLQLGVLDRTETGGRSRRCICPMRQV
jgi:hypothetical protein